MGCQWLNFQQQKLILQFSVWGLRHHTPTGALPLDPVRRLPSPKHRRLCPQPLYPGDANAWIHRSWSGSRNMLAVVLRWSFAIGVANLNLTGQQCKDLLLLECNLLLFIYYYYYYYYYYWYCSEVIVIAVVSWHLRSSRCLCWVWSWHCLESLVLFNHLNTTRTVLTEKGDREKNLAEYAY